MSPMGNPRDTEIRPRVDGGRTRKIVCYGCEDPRALRNPRFVSNLAWVLCGRIGMNGIKELTCKFDGGQGSGAGCTSVLVIEESHIAVHTWPESCSARIVIDSCKDFDLKPAFVLIRSLLNPVWIWVSRFGRERPTWLTRTVIALSAEKRQRRRSKGGR